MISWEKVLSGGLFFDLDFSGLALKTFPIFIATLHLLVIFPVCIYLLYIIGMACGDHELCGFGTTFLMIIEGRWMMIGLAGYCLGVCPWDF